MNVHTLWIQNFFLNIKVRGYQVIVCLSSCTLQRRYTILFAHIFFENQKLVLHCLHFCYCPATSTISVNRSLVSDLFSTKQYIPSLFRTKNIKTILNYVKKYNFWHNTVIFWHTCNKSHILTVHRDLVFKGLNFKNFLEKITIFISFL